MSPSFVKKTFQTLKQDSRSPLQNASLPLQRQINGEPASSTIPTWFEDCERATLEDLPVSVKMNSFSPSEIEPIHLRKECKRLIIGFGYLSMEVNHPKGELGACIVAAKVAFLFGVDDEATIIIDNRRKIIRVGGKRDGI